MGDILEFKRKTQDEIDEALIITCQCDDGVAMSAMVDIKEDLIEVIGLLCVDCGAEIDVKNGFIMTEEYREH